MTEENKRIARRVFEELWSEGKLEVIDEIISQDCRLYAPFPAEVVHVYSGYRERVITERQAFPDLRFNVEDQIAEGDKVVTRWTLSGTHQGEYMGQSPTGNLTIQMGISIFRIVEGIIKEIWVISDELGWIQQLGVTMPGSFSRVSPAMGQDE